MKFPYLQEEHIDAMEEELLSLLERLAVIHAPTGKEEARASFCKAFLEDAGAKGVYIDEAQNVLYPVGLQEGRPIALFMAHSDLVFPDNDPLPLQRKDGRIFCPGIGDNSANVAALLTVAGYIAKNGLVPRDHGILFVINSGEEGLGNLKGCRAVMERFGGRITEFVSFDSMDRRFAVNHAVGSLRYRVTIDTEGGHSFNAFGKKNAIVCLSRLICALDSVVLPTGGKTTYNVGLVSGGTSVNTIAPHAEMLYEVRSDNREDLSFMKDFFERTVAEHQQSDAPITVTQMGARPCGIKVDERAQRALEERAREGYLAFYGEEVSFVPGSTDCNIPLSLGIPAVCVGCCHGKGAHTREEYIEADSLIKGLKLCFHMVLAHF